MGINPYAIAESGSAFSKKTKNATVLQASAALRMYAQYSCDSMSDLYPNILVDFSGASRQARQYNPEKLLKILAIVRGSIAIADRNKVEGSEIIFESVSGIPCDDTCAIIEQMERAVSMAWVLVMLLLVICYM